MNNQKLIHAFQFVFFAAKSIKVFFSLLFTLLKCKGILSSFGGTSNTRFGMSHPLSNQRQLSAAVTRECQNIHGVLIQNACDGMVDRCRPCQNASGDSFSNE